MFKFIRIIPLLVLFFSFNSFAITSAYKNYNLNEESRVLIVLKNPESPENQNDTEISEDVDYQYSFLLRPQGPVRPEPVPNPQDPDPISAELLDLSVEDSLMVLLRPLWPSGPPFYPHPPDPIRNPIPALSDLPEGTLIVLGRMDPSPLPYPYPYPHPFDPDPWVPLSAELLNLEDFPDLDEAEQKELAYQGGHFIWVWKNGVRQLVYIPPPML